jgi:hypothetical protein
MSLSKSYHIMLDGLDWHSICDNAAIR